MRSHAEPEIEAPGSQMFGFVDFHVGFRDYLKRRIWFEYNTELTLVLRGQSV